MRQSAASSLSGLAEVLSAALADAFCQLGAPLGLATALDLAELPLPSLEGGGANQGLIRALGPLYLASELESAGLLPAAEALSAAWASGSLSEAVDAASEKLASFWRARSERFSASERQALFARIFGVGEGPVLAGPTPANSDFVLRLLDLAEALSRSGQQAGYNADSPQLEAEVRQKAQLLAENLSRHGNGFVLYAAGDILSAVRGAVEVLQALAAAHLWGSRDLWSLLLEFHSRRRRSAPDAAASARRGQAGMTLLAWLADALPALGAGTPSILPAPGGVVLAAASWIQASLAIEGQGQRSLARVA